MNDKTRGSGALIDYSEQRTEALGIFSKQYVSESEKKVEKILASNSSFENCYARINQKFIAYYSQKVYSDQDKITFRLNYKYEQRLEKIINQELKTTNDMLIAKVFTGHVKDEQVYE